MTRTRYNAMQLVRFSCAPLPRWLEAQARQIYDLLGLCMKNILSQENTKKNLFGPPVFSRGMGSVACSGPGYAPRRKCKPRPRAVGHGRHLVPRAWRPATWPPRTSPLISYNSGRTSRSFLHATLLLCVYTFIFEDDKRRKTSLTAVQLLLF